MISASFRQRFRATIEQPVARVFARTGLSPNALTLIGFAVAVVGAILAAQQGWLLAGLVVAFGAVFDLFDGALARATGKTSRFGAFLDSTMDRAGEAVVYIGIAAGAISAGIEGIAVLAGCAMAAAFMVSYTRAKSESLGFSSGSGMANVGLAPREIRTAILVIGLIVLALMGGIGPWTVTCPPVLLSANQPGGFCNVAQFQAGDIILGGTLALITILATVTAVQRIYFVYRQSQSSNEGAKK